MYRRGYWYIAGFGKIKQNPAETMLDNAYNGKPKTVCQNFG